MSEVVVVRLFQSTNMRARFSIICPFIAPSPFVDLRTSKLTRKSTVVSSSVTWWDGGQSPRMFRVYATGTTTAQWLSLAQS